MAKPRDPDEPREETYKVSFQRWDVTDIMAEFPKVLDLRIMEAIDLLLDNKHITVYKNDDLRKYAVFCNKDGERAFNSGYYMHKVYKFWIRIIGIPGGVIGIITLLSKLLC
jgi:hypothetical protein